MGKHGQNKHLREGHNAQSPSNPKYKRQKTSRDHVQNALAQPLHEVFTASESLSFENTLPASTSRRAAESVQHVPQMQRLPQAESHFHRQVPRKLPQMPHIADKTLERAVFTHPQCLPGHNQTKLTRSYDRLEFLGDAYIELIASRLIYSLYPHMPAGRLSQQRENLVRNESLAAFSVAYDLDKRAQLPSRLSIPASPNLKRRQTDTEKQWTKTLGDIFEAYVAAVIISNPTNGYQIAEEWLHKLWIPKLQAQDPAETRAPPAADSKQELSKRLLGRGIKLDYRDSAPQDQSESSAGKTWYTVGAFLTGWGWNEAKLGEGRALNKKGAGMIAATRALANPLTTQIASVKREFDRKVAEERAAQEQDTMPTERRRVHRESPLLESREKLKGIDGREDEEGEISDIDD